MPLRPLAPTPQFVIMCTPLEPKSLVSIGAVPRPPDVATSVLVTYMSAQEQSRMLEAIAMKDSIYVRSAIRPFIGRKRQWLRAFDATLVPFSGEKRCSRRAKLPF